MVETTFYILAILLDMPRCRLIAPIIFSSLQQTQCAYHIGMSKGERIFDASVNMAFSREMDDAVNLFIFNELAEVFEVADVHFHELIVRLILDIF